MPYLGNNCILHRARARPEHLLHVNALHSWGGGEESSLFRARDHTGSILNLFVFNQSIYSDVKDVSAPFLPSFRKVIATYFFLALFLFLVFLNGLPLPEGKGALQLLKKVATGFYSERIGKQGRLTLKHVTGLKLAAVVLPAGDTPVLTPQLTHHLIHLLPCFCQLVSSS